MKRRGQLKSDFKQLETHCSGATLPALNRSTETSPYFSITFCTEVDNENKLPLPHFIFRLPQCRKRVKKKNLNKGESN